MKLGFTGSRRGMDEFQIKALRVALKFMKKDEYNEFHHGDCIGADAQAAAIAKEFGWIVVGHPPVNEVARAFFKSDHSFHPREYIERNQYIVDTTDQMIAVPAEDVEQLRSGTWATIRYALKSGKRVTPIWPKGSTRMGFVPKEGLEA
jgi:hypothetical protein